VIDAFSNVEINNKRILLPRAKVARTILPEELTKMGGIVDEVTAYETNICSESKDELIRLLENDEIDAVTFTSSSTVSNFMSLLKGKDTKRLLKNVVTASIGPITSDTAKTLDINPDIEACEYTIGGLTDSLLAYYKEN
jgi:uroporphyrinogen III methyltransferase/synthase